MTSFVYFFGNFVVSYFLIVNSFYAFLIILAIPIIYRRFREVSLENLFKVRKAENLPSIAILIPAYNEENNVIMAIENALAVFYPQKEIIVINDGSEDKTFQLIMDQYQLVKIPLVISQEIKTKQIRGIYQSKTFPEILVIDKENGGRGDALNTGINTATSDLFLTMDVDTVLEVDSLTRMIRPFLTTPGVLAQGGTLRILNGCEVRAGKVYRVNLPKGLIPAIQVVEYLRAFLYGRLGWNALGGNLIIAGAFGLFNRKVVLELKGYDTSTVAEDFEITLKIQKWARENGNKNSIFFIPDPVAWTKVPDKLSWIARQRTRWHQGVIEVIAKYKSVLFNPRYGKLGLIGMPYMLIGEMIEPFFELAGWGLIFFWLFSGSTNFEIVIYILMVSYGITFGLTVVSIILEITTFRRYKVFPQLVKMFIYSFLENFGFRQLYIFWRIKGFYMYFTGKRKW